MVYLLSKQLIEFNVTNAHVIREEIGAKREVWDIHTKRKLATT